MADTPVAAPKKKSTISSRIIGEAGRQGKADATVSRDRSSADLITQQATLAGLQNQSPAEFREQNRGESSKDYRSASRGAERDSAAQLQSAKQAVAGSQANIARQNSALASDGEQFVTKKMTKDVLEGARFGEAVLGENGLGRSTDSADVNQSMDQLREQSLGFSGAESTARREQAMGNIGTATQGQQRALQAQLARAGVRGGAAGKQIGDVAVQGIQAQANAEQQLFIQGEDARREGTGKFAKAAGAQSSFDLGQAAKEKAIVLQSGMGFAQMGAAERGAKIQADASKAAAASQAAANSGGGGMSVVCTELHRQGLITTKVWNKNTSHGKITYYTKPYNYKGYLTWGLPVARLMKKSKLATSILAPIMTKWVNYLGGHNTLLNRSVYEILMVPTRAFGLVIRAMDFLKGKNSKKVTV